MKKVAIIGAGITGCSLAWYLKKKNKDAEIVIFEKNNALGGMIQTSRLEFFFEKGPRTFAISRSPDLLSLVNEAGLSEEIVFSDKKANKRYLYSNHKVRSINIFKYLVSALYHDLYNPKSSEKDESIASFFNRRFGSKVTEELIDPFVTGIYAGDINKLSMKSTFGNMFEMEKQYGSVIKGLVKEKRSKTPGGLFTLKNGLYSLIETLASQVFVELNADITIQQQGDMIYINNRGEVSSFDHIFVTTPFDEVKRLFPFVQDYPELSYAPILSVNCGYYKTKLDKVGFGYLVPSKEKQEGILGVVFDSCIFPLDDQLRLTVMLGGSHHVNLIHESDDQIEKKVIQCLKNHLNLPKPDYIAINRYEKAIAQYPIGHEQYIHNWLVDAKHKYPQVSFVSSFINSPSVNGRIKESKKLVEQLK